MIIFLDNIVSLSVVCMVSDNANLRFWSVYVVSYTGVVDILQVVFKIV